LQQNVDTIKAENDADILSEDPLGVNTDGVYMPSIFSIEKDKPEVNPFLSYFLVRVCVYVYIHIYRHSSHSAVNWFQKNQALTIVSETH
jgi:hypothetical protein